MVHDKHSTAKEAAAIAAAELIEEGKIIGLGTGSTASRFIHHLGERCRQGLKIQAVASSRQSEQQAIVEGIPLLDANAVTSLDLDVDGADEIDGDKRMIKGGGGALLREKIVAKMSREMIVIVDQHKVVEKLGKFPLAVEIVPFAYQSTLHHLQGLGYQGSLRTAPKKELFITENGNYIYDIHFPHLIDKPDEEQLKIRSIPGVVETGLFLHLACRVIVGYDDGHAEIRR